MNTDPILIEGVDTYDGAKDPGAKEFRLWLNEKPRGGIYFEVKRAAGVDRSVVAVEFTPKQFEQLRRELQQKLDLIPVQSCGECGRTL